MIMIIMYDVVKDDEWYESSIKSINMTHIIIVIVHHLYIYIYIYIYVYITSYRKSRRREGLYIRKYWHSLRAISHRCSICCP